jgi:hypothetical protein
MLTHSVLIAINLKGTRAADRIETAYTLGFRGRDSPGAPVYFTSGSVSQRNNLRLRAKNSLKIAPAGVLCGQQGQLQKRSWQGPISEYLA